MTETVPSLGRGGTAAGLFRLSRENSGTISKFADILSLVKVSRRYTLAAPGGTHPCARGMRIVPTQRTMEGYETSHYSEWTEDRAVLARQITPMRGR